jgi:hypothetical protein
MLGIQMYLMCQYVRAAEVCAADGLEMKYTDYFALIVLENHIVLFGCDLCRRATGIPS